jgi:hypothetical protein
MSEPDGAVVWQYDNGIHAELSPAVHYRVLSATMIDGYLFIVSKEAFLTILVMVEPARGNQAGRVVRAVTVMRDNSADGSVAVSAGFRAGATWKQSALIINHDQQPQYQKELRLVDCLSGSAK